MNITKKPHIKKRKVLKIKLTSAETVVSALAVLLIFNKKNKLIAGLTNLFKNLIILPPY
tara:strand:- start:269 stop:445 length:177 start_codon:yes stop_codon:yes gene_type:complete